MNLPAHGFEGMNRICRKLGGGFDAGLLGEIEDTVPALACDYVQQSKRQNEGVNCTFADCLGMGAEVDGKYDLYKVVVRETERDEKEPAFYYHSDHLGSAAYLTNDDGKVTQTLNYLPYGEDWVDVRYDLDPSLGQYRFNGKEKDYESGFHYYGARYYWSELLTGWLSVDAMTDDYPEISSYSYCFLNPVKIIDPDGHRGIPSYARYGTISRQQRLAQSHVRTTVYRNSYSSNINYTRTGSRQIRHMPNTYSYLTTETSHDGIPRQYSNKSELLSTMELVSNLYSNKLNSAITNHEYSIVFQQRNLYTNRGKSTTKDTYVHFDDVLVQRDFDKAQALWQQAYDHIQRDYSAEFSNGKRFLTGEGFRLMEQLGPSPLEKVKRDFKAHPSEFKCEGSYIYPISTFRDGSL